MRKTRKSKAYPLRKETIVFGLGLIPKEGVPEIKIRFNRSRKVFLGKITDSKDAADFLRKLYSRGSIELQESFIVLYLNRANEILGYYKHAIGGISSVVVDRRLIYAAALASASAGIILSHNHPTGSLKPSQADIETTKNIREAGAILDIRLLDHLIITKTSYFSFADNSMI